MFKNLKLGQKFIILFLVIGVIPSSIIGAVLIFQSMNSMEDQIIANLSAVAEYKTKYFEDWMIQRYTDMHLITGFDLMESACSNLFSDDLAIRQLGMEQVKQYFNLTMARTDVYSDMKLIDMQGNQLYSVQGFTGNVSNKDYFINAIKCNNREIEGILTAEFGCHRLYATPIIYSDELEEPTKYISHIVYKDGTTIPVAILVFAMNINKINEVLSDTTGLGETGETYLVGSDHLLQSDTRFTEHSDILNKQINTFGIEDTLERMEARRGPGICKNLTYENYIGAEVIGHNHYLPTEHVVLATEITSDEAYAGIYEMYIYLAIVMAVAIAAIIGVALIFARTLTKPINNAIGRIEEVAKGNLMVQLEVNSNDEIGSMSKTFNQFLDRLREVIRLLFNSITAFKAATQEISQGSQDLSQRSSEQASSLEEVSATIEETTSMIVQNAEGANQVNTQVQKTTAAMQEIDESSKKIADITNVINEIAFQTNLLALNASIEAARAGDAGKGFEVVANEVRNLAQRSSAQSKEIETLIKNSVHRIQEGVELVNGIAHSISEIASGAEQQKLAIEQIADAVGQLDTVTQQNASLAEESAATSEEISSQASQMADQVSFFNINAADRFQNKVEATPNKDHPSIDKASEKTGMVPAKNNQ